MNREKMQRQSFVLRNKKLRLRAPTPKPKPQIKKGVVKLNSYNSKKKAVANANEKNDLLARQQETQRILGQARSKRKPGGCGGCRRRSN